MTDPKRPEWVPEGSTLEEDAYALRLRMEEDVKDAAGAFASCRAWEVIEILKRLEAARRELAELEAEA